MSNRSIFYFFILIISVLLSLVLLGKLIPYPDKSSNFFAALQDKEQRLKTLPAGKIVLVGGSNVCFGFNSESISTAFGRPVCNLGLYAGFPLELYLNMILANCQKDDVVILIPEYSYFYSSDFSRPDLFNLAYTFPDAFEYFDKKQSFLLKSQFLLYKISYRVWYYLTGEYKTEKTDIYDRKNFNLSGDFTGHLNKNSSKEISGNLEILSKKFSDENLLLIDSFLKKCDYNEIDCYITFPIVDSTIVTGKVTYLKQLYTKLQDQFKGRILENPTNLILPRDYFFDTMYHLNTNGREIRTSFLINSAFKNDIFNKDNK